MNNIPFEDKPIALRRGEHKQEEFTKINPFQKVPVIDDDGFILTESAVIMRYLCEKYNLPEHWLPVADEKHSLRVAEYLNWHHAHTRLYEAMLFQTLVIVPKLKNKPINKKKVEFYRTAVRETVKHLQNYFLKGRPYLCGEEMSIADLLAVCELMQLDSVLEEELYKSNQEVKQWVDRVKIRLQPHFDEAHIIPYRLRSAFGKIKPKL
ncbi:hypothetical protein ScPMuIL_005931 [Solemya velum]